MNVLKGASAAALYGSRAGNGVILITTKSGKKQSGLGITVNAGVTVESMFLKPELQNTYGQGTNGIYNVKDRSSCGPVADGSVTTTSSNFWVSSANLITPTGLPVYVSSMVE